MAATRCPICKFPPIVQQDQARTIHNRHGPCNGCNQLHDICHMFSMKSLIWIISTLHLSILIINHQYPLIRRFAMSWSCFVISGFGGTCTAAIASGIRLWMAMNICMECDRVHWRWDEQYWDHAGTPWVRDGLWMSAAFSKFMGYYWCRGGRLVQRWALGGLGLALGSVATAQKSFLQSVSDYRVVHKGKERGKARINVSRADKSDDSGMWFCGKEKQSMSTM